MVMQKRKSKRRITMAEYTYKNVIINPYSKKAKNAVGKKCYMDCSPQGVLYLANKGLTPFCLSKIVKDSVCPFFQKN